MKTDIGAEAYDYEKFSGFLDSDENDRSYQMWLDWKMEEDKERRAEIKNNNGGTDGDKI